MNKSISQIEFLERQLLELEKVSSVSTDNLMNFESLKSELSKLKCKRYFLWKVESFIKTNKYKVKREEINNKNYFCIYFHCPNENIYVDADCLSFKKVLTAKASELLKNAEGKEAWINSSSPPAFWGNYINERAAKLSIPEFVYERDIDISNLIDRVFQSYK